MPGRGLVSKITHPLVSGDTARKYRTFAYDPYGNKTKEVNEEGEKHGMSTIITTV